MIFIILGAVHMPAEIAREHYCEIVATRSAVLDVYASDSVSLLDGHRTRTATANELAGALVRLGLLRSAFRRGGRLRWANIKSFSVIHVIFEG